MACGLLMHAAVTEPMQIRPGEMVLITRRTSEQRFFMVPSEEQNEHFLYALARASTETNVGVVSAFCGSNHYHATVVDRDGRRPDFLKRLNGLLGRVINYRLGRRGAAVWDNREPNNCELLDHETVIEKAAYCIANPVRHGLVRFGRDWPGVCSNAEWIGKTFEVPSPRLSTVKTATCPS